MLINIDSVRDGQKFHIMIYCESNIMSIILANNDSITNAKIIMKMSR